MHTVWHSGVGWPHANADACAEAGACTLEPSPEPVLVSARRTRVMRRCRYFRRNTIGVQLVFYIIYGNVQVAFAFFISCFFSNARTANITTWIWVLGAGLFAAQLMDNIFAEGRWFAVLLQIIPTFGVYRCAPSVPTPGLPPPQQHAATIVSGSCTRLSIRPSRGTSTAVPAADKAPPPRLPEW